MYLNIIKVTYDTFKANAILNVQKSKIFVVEVEGKVAHFCHLYWV